MKVEKEERKKKKGRRRKREWNCLLSPLFISPGMSPPHKTFVLRSKEKKRRKKKEGEGRQHGVDQRLTLSLS